MECGPACKCPRCQRIRAAGLPGAFEGCAWFSFLFTGYERGKPRRGRELLVSCARCGHVQPADPERARRPCIGRVGIALRSA